MYGFIARLERECHRTVVGIACGRLLPFELLMSGTWEAEGALCGHTAGRERPAGSPPCLSGTDLQRSEMVVSFFPLPSIALIIPIQSNGRVPTAKWCLEPDKRGCVCKGNLSELP